MTVSAFDLFKIGIGPSSSHTVGPMRAAAMFASSLADDGLLGEVTGVEVELFGSSGATGHGHGSVKAVVLGLTGELPETVDPAAAEPLVSEVRETAASGCSAPARSRSTSAMTSSCTGASGCPSTPTRCASLPSAPVTPS
jgi:L-serine deaminase